MTTAMGASTARSRTEHSATPARDGYAHRRLRAATAALHEAVGEYFSTCIMTRDAYSRYLMMNRPCVDIEQGLMAAGVREVLLDWDARQRRFALAADMETLGISKCDVHAIRISEDIGTLLGWSYVLEGSRLGARLVLRAVESTEDLELIAATRFLRHGAGMDFWTTFRTVLRQLDDDPIAVARACDAAVASFGCFKAAAENFLPAFLPGK